MKLFFLFYLLFLCVSVVRSWGILSFQYAVESYLNFERCNSNWLNSDIKALEVDLENKVFGQPFLKGALIPLLRYHCDEDSNPSKPLVLSFHGSPGTGKTYVSQLIADNLFVKGRNSEFYKHYTMADLHSLSEKELVDEIKRTVQACKRSLFVFDEIEKMPDGIFEVIKSFLDYYSTVLNVDFRINTLTKSFWDRGEERKNYELSLFQHELLEATYYQEGGLKGTRIVKNYLVDLYLPFLPLEKEHVVSCIKVLSPEISQIKLKKVVESILFVPEDSPIFSISGCKGIESPVRRRTYDEL